MTDIERMLAQAAEAKANQPLAANAQDLTLVTDDEYENSHNRTVAKDALGNYYDYDADNQEFVLRTVDRLKDIILNGGDGDFKLVFNIGFQTVEERPVSFCCAVLKDGFAVLLQSIGGELRNKNVRKSLR